MLDCGTAEDALLKRITTDPEKLGGKPLIRGRRIKPAMVLRLLANGLSREEILAEHPVLEPDDIDACLVFAAWLADESTPRAAAE